VFLQRAGSSLLVSGATLSLACEPQDGAPKVFSDRFAEPERWDEGWLNVRYSSAWERVGDTAVIMVPRPRQGAMIIGERRMEYLYQPVVIPAHDLDDVAVAVDVRIEGGVEAGALARWSYDVAYAALLSDDRLLLCRYDSTDRKVLVSGRVNEVVGWTRVSFRARRGRLLAGAESGGEEITVAYREDSPLPSGLVGLVANPTSSEVGGRAYFRTFEATALGRTHPSQPRIAYRFAGAIERRGNGWSARLAARTVVPEAIAFEIGRTEDLSDSRIVGPSAPRGALGAVRSWIDDLEEGTRYYWRPLVVTSGRAGRGPIATFRTPPPAEGSVRFAFGSCTSGRLSHYPSFARAASFHLDFFLHAGDWGYADVTSYRHAPDHFQARWTRLLRSAEVDRLLASTPLLFWQDDHDYQADNGWAATVPAYAVQAFDELHANPRDDYFDIRWGDLHIWCLDCRLFASDPAGPDDATKTRLGTAQKKWLKDGMSSSDAAVRIVASPMAFRDKVDEDAGWHNAYTHERHELLRFFSELNATVLVLSGDSHGQRLIHHHEFGELYEVTSSGTDFPPGLYGQGVNDPEHTLEYRQTTAFALVELDAASPERALTTSIVSSSQGRVLFSKRLAVRTPVE
jgi:hypothetical protein